MSLRFLIACDGGKARKKNAVCLQSYRVQAEVVSFSLIDKISSV
jgi:hypothetical protein